MTPPRIGARSRASSTGSVACLASNSQSMSTVAEPVWQHTAMGCGSTGSIAANSDSSAVSPPAEQPMTMAWGATTSFLPCAARTEAIDAASRIHWREVGGRRREIQALARTQAKETAAHKTVAEQRQRSVLQGIGEVDEHVAAQHEVRFAEH